MNKPNKIILHHSLTKDGKVVDFDAIKRYHIQHNGWKDIGYHYVVELVGNEYKIFKGRCEKEIGAHTKGQNANSIGICLVGNFDIAPPPQAQLNKLYELLKDIFNRYGKLEIYTHNHFAPYKTCPGTKFPLNEVINMVEGRSEKHWAEEIYEYLNNEGIKVHDKRFEDNMKRGEVLSLIKEVIEYVKKGN